MLPILPVAALLLVTASAGEPATEATDPDYEPPAHEHTAEDLKALFGRPISAQEAAAVHGEDAETLVRHLEVTRRNGNCAGAILHAREILAASPDDIPALHAVEECTRSLNVSSHDYTDTAKAVFENSRILSLVPELLDMAQVKDLVPILREVQTKGNKSVTDYLMLQALYEKLGEPENQIHALEDAIAADPDDPRPLLLLASRRFRDGERAAARALYRGYLASPRSRESKPYLRAYIAALAHPWIAMAILLSSTWVTGFLALQRSRQRVEALQGALDLGTFHRWLPAMGAVLPLVMAIDFLVTAKALPFGILVVMLFCAGAALVVPPLFERLRPVGAAARSLVTSLFTERFARAMDFVPPGWRILFALGAVFVMGAIVPTIADPDLRYGVMLFSALLFFGTVGSLLVTFLQYSASLRRSLRWIGIAATIPFLVMFVVSKWDDIGAPLMRAELPSRRAVGDLSEFLVMWGVCLFLALHLSRILADALTRPVKEMMERVAQIERGDFQARVEVRSKDEIGDLGHAVNRMAGGLARREFVERTFRRYVDKQVAEKILSGSDEGLRVEGRRMRAVVLFSDIRGFTTMSEKMAPEQVVAFLNEYFQRMVGVIVRHGGVIDKFIGDAIMAVWGVPTPRPDAALCAVTAALGMREEMAKLNAEFESKGHPRIGVGIGINAGDVVAGSIGSSDRLEYTVIGDVVNTAQRGEANSLAQQILVTKPVYEELKGRLRATALEGRLVKGKTEPVYFWAVEGLEEEKDRAAG